ncbi:tripartite tricarboxylate transporter substrate binding protein [Verticiella sediminum]|uniref:Tripartite tricarboxylate transporter substrate binding protein n=1 Tax=Verticiella sediminum TaxID=1247510 RepID=A0A556AUR9_9BURK|nr:tripartite tricarboxylate transporter substrate binding protein [Verticiella sediminum]TSH96640.1 tripartite tricarboxylate transporter substrate binding protein [Verticiella sediminum]
MRSSWSKRLRLGLIGTAFVAAPALAADYPERDITMVVPFPPGGTTDIIGRIVANDLGKALGRNVIVENKGGAGGNIGAAEVARAKPDGYTIMMGTVGTQSINQYLYANLPYDPDKDFVPVALAASVPNVLVLNPGFAEKHQIASVQDLIKYLQANPGKGNVGSSGNGTSIHLAAELFKSMTGTDFAHVPFRGSGPAVTALMAGDVDFMFDNLPSSMGAIQGGRLKAIAVTSAERSESLPDVPTIAESGVPGFDATSWFGVVAPAGTPPAAVAKLNQTIVQNTQRPEAQEQFLKQGAVASDMDPQAFGEFIAREREKWAKVVKESGAKVD